MQPSVNTQSPIVWDAPLNRGLLRWWLCLPNQNRGNTWRELTRKSDATITGATVAGSRGRPGGWGCYEYNGTSDAGQAAAIDLSLVSTLTVSLWLYWNSYSTNDDLALETGTTFINQQGIFYINPNSSSNGGAVRVLINLTTSGISLNGATFARPTAAAWHHYVICMDRNAGAQQVVAAYVDGVSKTLTPTNSVTTSTGGFGNWQWNFMARNNGASLQGAGKLDDVRINNRILSASEAAELFRESAKGYPRLLRRSSPPSWYPEQAGVTNFEYVPRGRRFRNRTLTRM